jgi:putative ABC transport system ATP-binding protein
MGKDPLIRLRNVTKVYDSAAAPVVALDEISLDVHSGEFLVITGKSGAGKTTLVNVLTGLDRVTGGEIWVGETAVHRLSAERAAPWRGRTVGVVFQGFELVPTLSVLYNVTLPMDLAGLYSVRQRRARAQMLLDEVEIGEHAHKRPAALSGGQQQRVAIARAMANDPPLLVADEPTGSLDSQTARAVMRVFERLSGQGKTVILVSHDRDVSAYASRTVRLADGRVEPVAAGGMGVQLPRNRLDSGAGQGSLERAPL